MLPEQFFDPPGIDQDQAERYVAAAVSQLGWTARDRFTCADVVELVRGMDYACTFDTLAEVVRKGFMADPGPQWTARDVVALVGFLESRRRWLPMPSKHDYKKSAPRRSIERARAAGLTPIVGLEEYSVVDCLDAMTDDLRVQPPEYWDAGLKLRNRIEDKLSRRNRAAVDPSIEDPDPATLEDLLLAFVGLFHPPDYRVRAEGRYELIRAKLDYFAFEE